MSALPKIIGLVNGKLSQGVPCARFPFTALDCGEVISSRLFNAYNSAVQTITGTPSTIQINVLTGANDILTYTLSSGELEIGEDGQYQINAKVSTTTTTNTRSTTKSWLEINGTLIDGSEFYTYDRNVNSGETSGSTLINIELNRGDLVRIRSEVESGNNNQTVSEACTLSLSPLNLTESALANFEINCGELDEEAVEICIDAGDLG